MLARCLAGQMGEYRSPCPEPFSELGSWKKVVKS